jgi:hypothetical protein
MEYKYRIKGIFMNFDKIVERKLWLVGANTDSKTDLCIEIGSPRWVEPDIEAACPVCIRGIMNEPITIFGSDLLNVLECALQFVAIELKNLPESQLVQWPGNYATKRGQ